MSIQAAAPDVMSMLYAITAKQGQNESASRKNDAEAQKNDRAAAFQKMQDEIKHANDAQKHKGFLGDIAGAIDSVCDAVVGGNPLEDAAKALDKTFNVKAFEIVYDFVRPDAILHAAAMVGAKVTSSDKITEAYDLTSATSSLKTRFQAVADATGEQKVMDVYAGVRDAVAGAMVTVGTCGAGTAAYVAIGLSAALQVESKLDVLGKLGVHGNLAMGLRLGAQLYAGAAGAASGFVLKGAATATSIATKVAVTSINASKDITEGGLQVGQAAYQHSTDTHMASSEADEKTQQQADRQIGRIVDGLRSVAQSYEKSLSTIASTINVQNQTNLSLAQKMA